MTGRIPGAVWLWASLTLVRVSVGTEFFPAGMGKLGDLEKFAKYFAELGIPLPAVQAPFVAGVEFFGGIALVIGLGTLFAAAPLAITMIVAIVTATEVTSLSHFLYLAEWNLFLLLTWVGFAGAGPLSLDRVIAERAGARA